MNNIYIYPMRSEADLKQKSPYVYSLSKGLNNAFNVVNYGKKMKAGILDIFSYIRRTDYLYFNWIENLSYTKVPFFLVIFSIAKLMNKKIIWTHHNKHPHKSNNIINKSLMNLMIKSSDYIIVHTKESFPLLKKYDVSHKIFYFFHPFFSVGFNELDVSVKKEYDLLIWGNVRASKGVGEFLDFLAENRLLNTYRIKIAGKFADESLYDEYIHKYKGTNLYIENRFLSHEELNELHLKSRIVFFPYTGSSVLNSGALITSLPKGIPVIGPKTGAFKEMGDLGYIYNYRTFGELIKILEGDNNTPLQEEANLKEFINEHTWDNFSEKLYQFIHT